MTKYIYILLIFYSCGTHVEYKTDQIENIFKSWNEATLNSLKIHISSTQNEQVKIYYENRYQILKSYLKIKNYNEINSNSIRYKLLQLKDQNWGKSFYIIESNESGEKVSVISYIVVQENSNTKIYKYEFLSSKWRKIDEYISNFIYEKDLCSVEFGKGQNQNDIIVTYIKNNKVISSDFFLFSTITALDFKNP